MDVFQDKTALCSVNQSGDTGPNYISPGAVALSTAVVLVNGLLSLWLKLDMHWQLVIGAIRCIVQLTVLGYILVPIFTYNMWWLVLLYSFLMLYVGCLEAVQRPAYTFQGMLIYTLVSIGSTSALFLSYSLLLVVRTRPWWQPQYFIPILGMLLGNGISGVSVGLTALLEEFTVGKDRIEQLLALGASRWEAVQASVQRSVKVALTPIINQMNVVGVVSIPGMMTGQILSGADPSQAARYQMIIMFIISSTTSVSAVACLVSTSMWCVDSCARLRLDRVQRRDKSNGWNQRLFRQVNAKVLKPLGNGISTTGRSLARMLSCGRLGSVRKDSVREPLLSRSIP